MSNNPLETIKRLESLAAWHRINAERAGADWVWEARLRAAEDLERQAAKIRSQLFDTGGATTRTETKFEAVPKETSTSQPFHDVVTDLAAAVPYIISRER